jgi:hypothetical protein
MPLADNGTSSDPQRGKTKYVVSEGHLGYGSSNISKKKTILLDFIRFFYIKLRETIVTYNKD